MAPFLPPAFDRPRFAHGGATTSRAVREAASRALGWDDTEARDAVTRVRERVLDVAGVARDAGFVAMLLPGDEVMALEAVLGSTVPSHAKPLIVEAGADGARTAAMADSLGLESVRVSSEEGAGAVDPAALDRALIAEPAITHVVAAQVETSLGALQDIQEIGAVARRYGAKFILDATAAFGVWSYDLEACGVDFLIAPFDRALEGLPGVSLVLARRDALKVSEGVARSYALDLFRQWKAFERGLAFRTALSVAPVLAAAQALDEWAHEGLEARQQRYASVAKLVLPAIAEAGLELRSPAGAHAPTCAAATWDAEGRSADDFVQACATQGVSVDSPREGVWSVSWMGRLTEADVRRLVAALAG